MLAPANYCFLYQELCVFVCLQACKKVAQCTFKSKILCIGSLDPELYIQDSCVYSTYSPSVLSGLDTEADGDIKADSWSLVFPAQRHLLVNLLGQNQRRLHLNHWAGPKHTQDTFRGIITA